MTYTLFHPFLLWIVFRNKPQIALLISFRPWNAPNLFICSTKTGVRAEPNLKLVPIMTARSAVSWVTGRRHDVGRHSASYWAFLVAWNELSTWTELTKIWAKTHTFKLRSSYPTTIWRLASHAIACIRSELFKQFNTYLPPLGHAKFLLIFNLHLSTKNQQELSTV